jgi:hypothetical protein
MRYSDLTENYSPDEDNHNQIELDDTRKDRLTLVHLSKLRKMREFRKYQEGVKSQQVKRQYTSSDDGGGGDMEL